MREPSSTRIFPETTVTANTSISGERSAIKIATASSDGAEPGFGEQRREQRDQRDRDGEEQDRADVKPSAIALRLMKPRVSLSSEAMLIAVIRFPTPT